VRHAIDFWTAHNQCRGEAQISRHDDIERETYADCAGGVQVQLITVHGGGHAWPGGERGSIFGDRPTDQLDASEVIWDFFSQHSKPTGTE
jgi:polyhydroxybutyrate depolymerase